MQRQELEGSLQRKKNILRAIFCLAIYQNLQIEIQAIIVFDENLSVARRALPF